MQIPRKTMQRIVSEVSTIADTDKQILSDAGIKISVDIYVLEYSDIELILPETKILKTRQLHRIGRYVERG